MHPDRSAKLRAILLFTLFIFPGSGCDSRDFQKARRLDTREAYTDYLENHPRGRHGEEARKRLDGLRFELPKDTNIVLVIIDTLRIDHLGCFGYGRDTSPFIDSLAGRSVLFEQAVSQSPWTRPSIASFLTSVYPSQHGIMKETEDVLAPEFTTLAEFLKARGWRTAGFTPNPNINSAFGFDQGFDYYHDSRKVWANLEISGEVVSYEDTMDTAEEVNRGVFRWLEHEAKEPFYLQLLYLDPHFPYSPPAPFSGMFSGDRKHIDLYDGEIRYTDKCLGDLVTRIEEGFPDTLFVIISDHGEGLRDNVDANLGRQHGHFLYDTETRALLMFHSPLLPETGRVAQMVQMIDGLPTILDLFGLGPGGSTVQGRSLKSLLVHPGLPIPRQEYAYSETDFRRSSKLSVRTEKHKYVHNRDFEKYISERLGSEDPAGHAELVEEMYDLGFFTIERPQQDNIILKEKGLARKMRAALDEWRGSLVEIPHSSIRPPPLDPETRKRLEALGYMGGGKDPEE